MFGELSRTAAADALAPERLITSPLIIVLGLEKEEFSIFEFEWPLPPKRLTEVFLAMLMALESRPEFRGSILDLTPGSAFLPSCLLIGLFTIRRIRVLERSVRLCTVWAGFLGCFFTEIFLELRVR